MEFWNTKHLWALLLMVAAALLLMTSPSAADIKLVFGTYTADKPTSTVKKIKPILRYLEKTLSVSLGEPVTIATQIARNYDKGIDQLTDGKVDFARFGPASYVLAKDKNADIEILAMEAVKGGKTFSGIICVHQDSTINSMAQLKGRTFAFGNELSTIGRYLAQSQLLDVGIKGDDLKRYAYLGRHDRVGTAVGNGEFDAGALKLNTFRKLQKKKVAIRELLRFDNVTKPWIARAGLESRIAIALRDALLELSEPALLKSLKKSGFLPGNDGDYDPIRTAMKKSRKFNQ